MKYCNIALLLHRTSCPEVEIRILYVYTDTVPFHVFKSYKCKNCLIIKKFMQFVYLFTIHMDTFILRVALHNMWVNSKFYQHRFVLISGRDKCGVMLINWYWKWLNWIDLIKICKGGQQALCLEFIIIDKFCLWLQIHGMHACFQNYPKNGICWRVCVLLLKYDHYEFNHFIMCWTDCVTVNVLWW